MSPMLLRRQVRPAAVADADFLLLDGDQLGKLPTLPDEDGAEIAVVIRRMLLAGLGMAGTILALLLGWVVIG